jgi:hypothetical protein
MDQLVGARTVPPSSVPPCQHCGAAAVGRVVYTHRSIRDADTSAACQDCFNTHWAALEELGLVRLQRA